jgi:hypothetical protein
MDELQRGHGPLGLSRHEEKNVQQLLFSFVHALRSYIHTSYTTQSDTCKWWSIVRTYHLRIMLVWLRRIVLNKLPSTTTTTLTNIFIYVYTHRLITVSERKATEKQITKKLPTKSLYNIQIKIEFSNNVSKVADCSRSKNISCWRTVTEGVNWYEVTRAHCGRRNASYF